MIDVEVPWVKSIVMSEEAKIQWNVEQAWQIGETYQAATQIFPFSSWRIRGYLQEYLDFVKISEPTDSRVCYSLQDNWVRYYLHENNRGLFKAEINT